MVSGLAGQVTVRRGYVPQRRPYAHQQEANGNMAGKQAFALLMAMRTGKTKVLLDDYGSLEANGQCEDLVVIAPAGVYRTWEGAMRDHFSSDLLTRYVTHTWAADENNKATQRAREAFLNTLNPLQPRVLLVNIEALGRVQRARDFTTAFMRQRRNMCAVDESTIIKNESEQTFFVLDKIRPLAHWRRLLTGLPTPRSPLDLFFQFYFLDWRILGHATYATYKARYAKIEHVCMLPNKVLHAKLKAKIGGAPFLRPGIGMVSPSDLSREEVLEELAARKVWVQQIPRIKEYMNEDELWSKIAPHSYRKRLEDCYDLPAKMYSVRHVEATAEQKRIYKELKQNAIAELSAMEYVTATHVMTRLMRMHQVMCGHVKDDDGNVHELATNRVKELLALLEDYDGKAIIWCSYDHDLRRVRAALMNEYGEEAVAAFWGGNRADREDQERRYLSNPACRFMVATPSAGGRGRTWVCADLVVYFSNTDNLEHRSQSEERAQGVGKTTSVGYVDLVVPGTQDERILEALRNKINMAATITNDNWREWVV